MVQGRLEISARKKSAIGFQKIRHSASSGFRYKKSAIGFQKIRHSGALYYSSRYLDDLLNNDNPYFEGMLNQIYPPELQNTMRTNCLPSGQLFPKRWPLSNQNCTKSIMNKDKVKHHRNSDTKTANRHHIRTTALERSVLNYLGA